MDQPSTSQNEKDAAFLSPTKKRPRKPLSVTEKLIISNAYKYVYQEESNKLEAFEEPKKDECVTKVAAILGIGKRVVYIVLKEFKENYTQPKPPKKPGPKLTFKDKFDEFIFSSIRRNVHQFFFNNELPTIAKVLDIVNNDPNLPNMSKETLRKLLEHINFKYTSRSGKSVLVDRQDVIIWRQHYLRQIIEYRNQGRFIYYHGHTTKDILVDKKVTSQAFVDGPTVGLKNTGKGKRLIISHIGNQEGFLEDGLLIFEAKKLEDNHDENAACFEEFFEGILPKLKPNSVIVMDNAPYQSREIETAPRMSWNKSLIQAWLYKKNIPFQDDMVKATLLELVPNNVEYSIYAVDEIAARQNITILRLPPFHSELNPIDLVWVYVKEYVAKNNIYILEDVKKSFIDGVNNVTPEKWSDCVSQILDEERKMGLLDPLIDDLTDRYVSNVTNSDSDMEFD